MAKKQTVEIELKATDHATPVFDRVSSGAQKTKARLQELYAAGAGKTPSSADFAKKLMGSVSSSGLGSVAGLSGVARSHLAASTNAGTASLVQSALREAQEKLAAAEALRFDSLSHGEKVLEKTVARFKELGVNVDTSAKSVRELASGIQSSAQEKALRSLADSAGLSKSQFNALRKEVLGLEPEARSLGRVLMDNKLAVAGWGAALFTAGKIALEAAVRVDKLYKSYASITGSLPAARQQLDFMYEATNRLGLEFFSTAEASKGFFAAVRGTSLEGKGNEIWQSVLTAGSALSLSREEMDGAFRALGQMVSKGKVQAEELRGQLGEQLPGAFGLAARAMGVTTTELDKMLERGEVLAEDLLPKLAVEIQKTYGEAAMQAANGLQQSMNRVNTEWERFKSSILDSGGVSDALSRLSSALKGFNDFSQKHEDRQAIIRSLEARGVQKMGYEKKWGGTEVGGFGWQHRIFYTDEQIDAEVQRIRKQTQRIKREQEQAVRETSVIAKASAARNSVLGNTAEYQLSSLHKERDARLDEQKAYIELVKAQNGDLGQALADLAKMEAEFDRREAEILAKSNKKNVIAAKTAEKERAKQAREEEKARKQEAKDLRLTAEVMRELEQKTGQYGIALESTNRLIEQQAALWRAAGVPEEYIAQLSEIRRLEASTDGLDKMRLGWMEFYAESMDWGTQAGSVLTGTVDSFSASLAEMAMTGKASFSDLARSMASDLTKIATKMMMVWAIEKALGWVTSSLTFNGLNADAATAAASTSGYAGMGQRWSGGSALGNVFMGAGSLHDYSGSIVSKPTLFTHGSRLPQYASGAGLMGEAGPEAVMPLTRIGGRLGVDASGAAPRINLIINNNASGVDVQTSQRENADGSMDIEATIVRVVDRDMNRRGGIINQSLRKNWGQRSIVTKR